MSWKFTFLGLEVSNTHNRYKEKETMTKGKTKQQKRFSKAVTKSHNKNLTPKQFGRCMKGELT